MRAVKKMEYKVWYRVTSGQGFVEVTLFVANTLGMTIVAQQEAIFDTLEDAQFLINELLENGEEVEMVTNMPYIG